MLCFLKSKFQALLHEDTGQDVVEYALVGVCVALTLVSTLHSLTNAVVSVFTAVSSTLTNAI